jgi:elongation factor Ts
MIKVSLEHLKQLRQATSLGVADCRSALEQAKGDTSLALEILKKKGLEIAAKKSERQAKAGRIASYVHFDHKIGVMTEINSETDFVARNEDFVKFCSDVALHIAAMNPKYIKKEDLTEDILKEQVSSGLNDFYKNNCLLEQAFVKDPSLTIKDYLNSIIAKVGENIVIRRFTRFQLGQ